MDTEPDTHSPRVVVDQAPGEFSSGRLSGGDTLLLHNVLPTLTYAAIHRMLKAFGTVKCIRLIYLDNSPSNRCYVIFTSSSEARSAYEAVPSLSLARGEVWPEVLSSRNIEESDDDYLPNIFEGTPSSFP